MQRPLARATCSTLLALTLVACGSQPSAPTAAPVAPTAISTEIPTASPTEAPTQAPTEAPTAAPTQASTQRPTAPVEAVDLNAEPAAVIAAALRNTKQISHYTVTLDVGGTGLKLPAFDGSGGMLPTDSEVSLIAMEGAFNGDDNEIKQKGAVTALFGGDSEAGLTSRRVAGKDYIYGPVAMIGASEETWYVMGDGQSFGSSFALADLINTVDSEDAALLSEFTAVGNAVYNTVQCNVYMSTDTAAQRFFDQTSAALLGPDAIAADSDKRLILTACEDGYIYGLELDVENASQDFGFELELRDHNGDVQIEAPTDAAELKM